MAVKGYVMQLQPFSVNDGDGIRTTIFLAGCPLRCKWCANPEGFAQRPLIGWYERKCIGCGACRAVCCEHIGINLNIERARCKACGSCVSVCPKLARTQMVSLKDADDIIEQVRKHEIFYRYSKGGVTFSGGEATAQPRLLNYLSEALYDMNISMAIESCGHFEFDTVRESLERMDLIFMDLKLMDDEKHKLYTGVSNELILRNIGRMSELSAKVVIRIPVIGGVNNDEDNIRASAVYVHTKLPKASMELLPYHIFGKVKYEAIGLPYEHDDFYTPNPDELEHLKELVRKEGVETVDYR